MVVSRGGGDGGDGGGDEGGDDGVDGGGADGGDDGGDDCGGDGDGRGDGGDVGGDGGDDGCGVGVGVGTYYDCSHRYLAFFPRFFNAACAAFAPFLLRCFAFFSASLRNETPISKRFFSQLRHAFFSWCISMSLCS